MKNLDLWLVIALVAVTPFIARALAWKT